MTHAEKIIKFWFSDDVTAKHFIKDPDFDAEIRETFLALYQEALGNTSTAWFKNADGYLALVILFDQFPRNMFRDTPQAFATDAKACEIAREAINQDLDAKLTPEKRTFLYMPFMHSESLEDQNYCVELYQKLGNQITLNFAIAHFEIIKRFGRFPHRNLILGRESTEEEAEFLSQPGSSF